MKKESKFIISAAVLMALLKEAALVIPKSVVLPICEMAHCTVTANDKIKIHTTDSINHIILTNDCEGREDFDFTIPVKSTLKFLATIKDQPLLITYTSITSEDGKNDIFKVKVAANDCSTTLTVDGTDSFPKIPNVDFLYGVGIDPEIIEALEKAIHFENTNVFYPKQWGVLLDVKPNDLCIVGTDAHRMYKADLKRENQVCFPIKVSAFIIKHIGQATRLIADTKHVYARTNERFDKTIISKVGQGKDNFYDNYARILENPIPNKITLNTKEMIKALNRVFSIKEAKYTRLVTFEIGKTCEVGASSEYGGDEITTILYLDPEVKLEKHKTGFNGDLLMSIMKLIESEQFTMEYPTDPTTAHLIREIGKENELYLIMPIQL